MKRKLFVYVSTFHNRTGGLVDVHRTFPEAVDVLRDRYPDYVGGQAFADEVAGRWKFVHPTNPAYFLLVERREVR